MTKIAIVRFFKSLRDVNREATEKWLVLKTGEGMAARTRNSYLQAIRGFLKWCVATDRLTVDPLRQVAKADEKTDRRKVRRSFTPAELSRFLYAARWRPLADYGRKTRLKDPAKVKGTRGTWERIPLTFETIDDAVDHAREKLRDNPEFIKELDLRGLGRAVAYKALVLTGLRRGELASITESQIVLDSDSPCLFLAAKDAKNGAEATIPIRAVLADDIRGLIDARRAASPTVAIDSAAAQDLPVFDVPKQLIKAFDRDLKAAGILKHDDRGRSLDVHALRTSFGTLLSVGGVAPRTAQAAMRHSKIDLTMNSYTDPRMLDVVGAMDALPSLPIGAKPEAPESQRATGTDGQSLVAPTVAPNGVQSGATESIPDNSAVCGESSANEKNPTKQIVSWVS